MTTPLVLAAWAAASLAAALLSGAAGVADAANVVLVHGFLGFGPTELWGMKCARPQTTTLEVTDAAYSYWGWTGNWPTQNYTHTLEDGGRNAVYYAVIGKVSSNHDRACELYAQIVGAKTDYGYWHALQNNHSRWGPDYTGIGFLPTWSVRVSRAVGAPAPD